MTDEEAAAKSPVRQMGLPKAALAAFMAMMVCDLTATAMVIWESHYEWWQAGFADVLGYLANLACSVLAIDSILKSGFRNKRSLVLIGAVTVANWVGTVLGVLLVQRLTSH